VPVAFPGVTTAGPGMPLPTTTLTRHPRHGGQPTGKFKYPVGRARWWPYSHDDGRWRRTRWVLQRQQGVLYHICVQAQSPL